jgi:TRAP-type C4-dicarboxylate transport system permease small subunit
MVSFERIVFRLSRRLNILSGIFLTIMMGLTFVNVVSRAVWRPLFGTYEYTGFLAALTIALALAHCAVNKGHVALTVFVEHLPKRVQAVLDVVVSLIGCGLYGVLAWQCVKYAIVMYHSGELAIATQTPFYPFICIVAFGFLMLALVLLNDFFNAIQRVFKK